MSHNVHPARPLQKRLHLLMLHFTVKCMVGERQQDLLANKCNNKPALVVLNVFVAARLRVRLRGRESTINRGPSTVMKQMVIKV